ncbi:hypothetical protein D9Y22_12420 [Methylorubrum sp. DB1722]|nr:hypothetical protein [Methylorubrum sp. DB1722]
MPPEVVHDHSGGQRAFVTHHAVRRFCERVLGLGEEALEGVGDREAVDALRILGMPVDEIRDRLAFFGGVAARRGASGICRDGWAAKLRGGRVTTVVSHGHAARG